MRQSRDIDIFPLARFSEYSKVGGRMTHITRKMEFTTRISVGRSQVPGSLHDTYVAEDLPISLTARLWKLLTKSHRRSLTFHFARSSRDVREMFVQYELDGISPKIHFEF
jgi:hypothetical protein